MVTYDALLQESLGTDYILGRAKSRTRLALANLAVLITNEERIQQVIGKETFQVHFNPQLNWVWLLPDQK